MAIPAAWITKHASSSTNGRLRRATASWARSDGSLAVTAPVGARRVPRKVPSVPATIMTATKIPIQRCPGMPLPPASTTIGASPPEIRMATASSATRQVINRVRSA